MVNVVRRELELANIMNYWENGDLYTIVIDWVAERQREKKLSDEWMSVQSFNGDKLLTMRVASRPIKGGGPYIVIYNDRYEAHNYINWKLGFVEILGKCAAADPDFFEKLLNDMIGIQTAIAIETLGDMYEC